MDRLENLFQKYIDNNISADEYAEMWQLIDTEAEAGKLTPQMLNLWEENPQYTLNDAVWDNKIKLLKTSIKPVKLKRTFFWKYLAAASIIIALGTGLYFSLFSKDNSTSSKAVKNTIAANDVKAPQTNRAIITLADGRQVYLDSISNGQIAQEGNISLVKLPNGQLVYETVNGEVLKEMQYNTLYNPAGSKVIDIRLSEGSHVWLNAGSSITYPVAFIGNERKIKITGEAYFEVAPLYSGGVKMPFKVNIASKGEVEVLGTHFNINSYSDESSINTTLLEGSVKISSFISRQTSLLTPGQQAQLNLTGQININKNVDVDEVMAWKNGKFIFRDADIQTIMRQIERWYDVEVSFSKTITNEQFVGSISRNVNISQILKMLEQTGTVKFEVEGKKVVVK
jgi:ferric-dicitrate binding protein FerR (iron transport regulator)